MSDQSNEVPQRQDRDVAAEPREQRAYTPPHLVEYGTVAKLTQTGGATFFDGGGMRRYEEDGLPVIRRLPSLLAAAAALAAARACVFAAPGRAVRWASVNAGNSVAGRPRDILTSQMLGRAVASLGATRLFRATCLEQSVALVLLLRAASIPSHIVVGVTRAAEDMPTLRAHAWVESCGVVVLGGALAPEFVPLLPASPNAVASCPG